MSNPLAAFANFSIDDLESVVEVTTPPATPPTPVVDNNNQLQPPAATTTEPKVEDGTKETQQQQQQQQQQTTTEVEVPVVEFKIPEEASTQLPASYDMPSLVKELGLQDPDKFKSVADIHNHYQTQIDEFKTKAEQLAQNAQQGTVDLKNYSPETQAMMMALESGMTIEEYMNPTAEVDSYIRLDNEAIVRADLQARGYEETAIQTRVDRMLNNGTLDDRADDIRAELLGQREVIVNNHNAEHQARLQTINTQRTQTETKNFSEIEASLTKINNFMGGNIGDEHKAYVINQFKSGKFRDALSNPDDVAQFLLYKAFGEQALKTQKTNSYQQGRDKLTDSLLNVPPSQQTGASKNNVVGNNGMPPKEGDFSAWGAIKDVMGG